MTSTVDIRALLPSEVVDDEMCDYIQSLIAAPEEGTVATIKEMLSSSLSKKELRSAMKTIRKAVKSLMVSDCSDSSGSSGVEALEGPRSLMEGAQEAQRLSALDMASGGAGGAFYDVPRYQQAGRQRRKKSGKSAGKARDARSSSPPSSDAKAAEGLENGRDVDVPRWRSGKQRRRKGGKHLAGSSTPEEPALPAPPSVDPQEFEGMDDNVESVLWTNIRGRDAVGQTTSVNLKRLNIFIGTKELLKDTTLRLNGGEVYGLVGRNGVGKTTLLRYIVTNKIDNFPSHLRSVLVEQEVQGGPDTALQEVVAADAERNALLAEEERLMEQLETSPDAVAALEAVTNRLLAIDAYDAESRAASILRGIGFSDERMAMPTSALSGGWRMRVAFAKALFSRPHLLLMDEPSNHLDLVALAWLEQYVTEHRHDRITVIVSHDRALLNNVATEIIHFKEQRLDYYPGNFDAFEKALEDFKLKKERQQDHIERRREHLMENLKKLEAAAAANSKDSKRSKQIASKKKKMYRLGVEKMEDGRKFTNHRMQAKLGGFHGIREGAIDDNAGGWKGKKRRAGDVRVKQDKKITFRFARSAPLTVSGPLLQLREASHTYVAATAKEAQTKEAERKAEDAEAGEGKEEEVPAQERKGFCLKPVTLNITPRSRFAVVGENGAGKSTLLKLITGALLPTSGEVVRHRNLRVETFSQHQIEALDVNATATEYCYKQLKLKTEGTLPLLDTDGKVSISKTEETEIRKHLGAFGITGEAATIPIRLLSGGQKARVALADINLVKPHILIMDEPTNNLDYDSIDALGEGLAEFDGGISEGARHRVTMTPFLTLLALVALHVVLLHPQSLCPITARSLTKCAWRMSWTWRMKQRSHTITAFCP